MNYNIKKDKQQKIDKIDKAQTALEPNRLKEAQKQQDSHSKDSHTKSHRKNLTIYMSEELVKEVDEFLQEYGKAKETRNAFAEESMRFYLAYRKSQLQAELEQKLQKLKEMNK